MLAGVQEVINWGAPVILPIIIAIFALILGTGLKKAIKAGLTVGIGFVGLNLITGLLGDTLGQAAQAMVKRLGLSLTTLDIGWPAASAISYSTLLGISAIPLGIGVDLFLLFFGLTKTLNIDIWNFWHVAFIGGMVYGVGHSFPLALFSMLAYQTLLYFLADLSAPTIKKYYHFPNVTFPHGIALPGYIFAWPLNWLFDRIPGFNRLQADPKTIQKRFGLFGETSVMGLLIGLGVGILAGYQVGEILNLGIETAAVMVLLPKMVSLLMEGLAPVSQAANQFVKKRFPSRELYIGMDAALAVGDQAVLAVSLLMIPITLLLALVLPGNQTLPFGDFATISFAVSLMVPVFRGNIVRAVVGGTIYLTTILYLTSWVAPLVTKMAQAAQFDLGHAPQITALIEGGLWPTALFVWGARSLPWVISGLVLLLALGGLYGLNRKQLAHKAD
ncbi:PTS galactitol transporter subunit IIC [Ligilactobacillus pabuli]|uniref:PTS galactitol transporter subunit IIC n=1 Tax=Ligilactobacillus pabuli TaxID=2886039 RepID=A0ABQ5JJH5_9LACO|nr:PTS transporter subunit IIC [Ligilactobacillus pabuli]GKS81622.1 PTS galactitol transporter subunit IIC [Ligilactobacillus pabuli]